MKKLFILFSLWPIFLWGQINFNFEDGHLLPWEQFPDGRWSVYSEDPLNGSYSLRHSYDNPESGCDKISLHHEQIVMDSCIHWSFKIRYDYKPSGSNNWSVFLLSDENASKMDRDSSINALILGVNYTGTDDHLSLYHQEGDKTERIFKSDLNWETLEQGSTIAFDVWKSRADTFCVQIIEEGKDTAVKDVWFREFSIQRPEYFGFHYSYTSSKDRLFYFDDVRIDASFFRDTIAPEITGFRIVSADEISLYFNEDIFAGPEFRLSTDPDLQLSYLISDNKLHCKFNEKLNNYNRYELEIIDLQDQKGNSGDFTYSFDFFIPGRFDIKITEIMADPTPPVYLPEHEYVEVFNRCLLPINILGWKLQTGNKIWELPEIIIPENEYHVFTSEDGLAHIKNQDKISRLFTNSYTITNSGQQIILLDRENKIIDAVNFNLSWYRDKIKQEGGWSLEMIDPENLCAAKPNWKASESNSGGTPGYMNSVNGFLDDRDPPFIKGLIIENNTTGRMVFNEAVQPESFMNTENFYFLQSENSVIYNEIVEPSRDELIFYLNSEVDKKYERFIYEGHLIDCNGNVTMPADTFLFGQPAKVNNTDIIITEILFSPFPGCPEFIEIFNRSTKLISLHELFISVSKSADFSLGENISERDYYIFPGQYRVLTRNPEQLEAYYIDSDKRNFFEVPGLPGLPNDGADVTLSDRAGLLIDRVSYDPDQHFPLISDFQGVSLERISISGEQGNNSDWHSASTLAGNASPGVVNSQNKAAGNNQSDFKAVNEVFSPNNDGQDDFAIIEYNFRKEGFVANIFVFSPSGRIIKTIGRNDLMSVEGIITWDGRSDQGALCSAGIYLIYMEAFHLQGEKRSFKEAVVLGK